MPKLCTPRSLPILILKGLPSAPGGSSAPTVAQGMRMPTRALGAPQTMFSSSGPPTSTWQTRRRSASGCCTASLISPTTMPVNGGATGSSSSTSRPAMVKVSASSWVVSDGLQYWRNQDSGNCIVGLFGVQACSAMSGIGRQGVLAFQWGAGGSTCCPGAGDGIAHLQHRPLRFHDWNCDRKRMSPSKNRRRSLTP